MENHATNADEKGGLIGKKWKKVYNGYFDNPEIALFTAKACEEIIPQLPKQINILEIGAGTGIVGETVCNFLRSKGFIVQLTISDKIADHVQANKNPKTIKAVFDNKNIPFPDQAFDLVLARSVTHYEPTLKQETKVLEEVKRVLKPDGFFINQAPTMFSVEEANLVRNIHLLVKKPMNLQSKTNVESMLKSVFPHFNTSDVIPPNLNANRNGFMERYNIPIQKRPIFIKKIKELIESIPETTRPNTWAKSNDFGWQIPYRIFICRK